MISNPPHLHPDVDLVEEAFISLDFINQHVFQLRILHMKHLAHNVLTSQSHKICLVYALRPPPLLHFFFCSHALSQLISNGLTPTVTDRVIFGLLNHGARQCPWHSYHYFSSPFRLTLFLPTLPISFLHILNPHPLGSLPSAVFLHKVKRRVPDAGSD